MKIFWSLLITFSFLIAKDSQGQECPIIPFPNTVTEGNGSFELNHNTTIQVKDEQFKTEARYLKKQLLKYSGFVIGEKKSKGNNDIILIKSTNNDLEKKGAYSLEMKAEEVKIKAADRDGIFNGITSFLQLAVKGVKEESHILVPCWNITDQPLYQWRGFMLDESRHFFGKTTVKQLLNQMAWLKLNRFHWHLTDVPGWRLEIKGYPLLNLVGGIGNYSNPLAPAKYYTQEDIQEIVAYAKERHIEVIPEIDMPGHATAANKAYPQFSGGITERYPNFTFNPGKEETYQYLTDILQEVSVLFPSGRIHLGGDEVSFGIKAWNNKPEIKTLMEKESLKNLKDVENYFFNRMTDSSLYIFDKVLAWDEAVDGSLPVDHTVILWWRHDKPQQLTKALKKGYKVVLCPRIPLYFDFVQKDSHIQGRKWAGKYSSVEGVYSFTQNTYLKDNEKHKNVIGIQANLWTERIQTKKRLNFMTYPRITALSEAAWTNPENRNYDDFLLRLQPQLELYQKEDIYYFNPIEPERSPEVVDMNLELNID